MGLWHRVASDGVRYRAEWTQPRQGTVLHLRDHPGIVAWCRSNEGWGLAGLAYAQFSDVEEETSGLVTCDRRVVKLDGVPRSP